MKKLLLLCALAISSAACAVDATNEESDLETTTEELTYVPGQYEVDALIKDLKAGKFNAGTLPNFVDKNAGAYVIHRPGAFDDVTYYKAVTEDPYTWGVARSELFTFAMTDFNRRAIPKFQCENVFKATVEDPATGKMVNITTGIKMFIHRWQPGGVQLMNPVSKVLTDRITYAGEPNDDAHKKAIATAKAFEKNISVKLVVPALIFNKKDAAGKAIPSNPGGANGAPISLYFGRVNGVWKHLVADIAENSCEA